jgi:hypothetical protein
MIPQTPQTTSSKICPHLSTLVTIKKHTPQGNVVEAVEVVYAPCAKDRCVFWEAKAPTIHPTKQGELGECTKKLADYSMINSVSFNAQTAQMLSEILANSGEETEGDEDDTENEESEVEKINDSNPTTGS